MTSSHARQIGDETELTDMRLRNARAAEATAFRDAAAQVALAGLMRHAAPTPDWLAGAGGSDDCDPDRLAAEAFRIADAMLRARQDGLRRIRRGAAADGEATP